MIWDLKNYLFWGVQVPSAIVLWACAITVTRVIFKTTKEVLKNKFKEDKNESK